MCGSCPTAGSGSTVAPAGFHLRPHAPPQRRWRRGKTAAGRSRCSLRAASGPGSCRRRCSRALEERLAGCSGSCSRAQQEETAPGEVHGTLRRCSSNWRLSSPPLAAIGTACVWRWAPLERRRWLRLRQGQRRSCCTTQLDCWQIPSWRASCRSSRTARKLHLHPQHPRQAGRLQRPAASLHPRSFLPSSRHRRLRCSRGPGQALRTHTQRLLAVWRLATLQRRWVCCWRRRCQEGQ